MCKEIENIWPDITSEDEDNEKIIEFLKKQCYFLEKITESKIKSQLFKYSYKMKNTMALKRVCDVFSSVDVFEKRLNDEIINKENINTLFKKQEYVLTIYNEKYRFNIFNFSLGYRYPILLELDKDIGEEVFGDDSVLIESYEDFKEKIKIIFSSLKIKKVINKLLKD